MKRHELVGWLLFTLSVCFFVAASLRSGDVQSLIGSLLFLGACFFFMAPLRHGLKPDEWRSE